jgi:hypothetical protein
MNIGEVKVGMRFFHRTVKHGVDRIVVVRELSDKSVSYTYEDDGHTSSTQPKDFRREDRFRPAGDAPARPLPRVELRSPPPGAELEVVTREAPKPKETPIATMPEDLGVPDFVARGRGCVVVADVERALGYAPKSLTKLIRGAWASELAEGRDFIVLPFGEAVFMLGTSKVPSGGTLSPRGLMVLWETGFDQVLQKTDKPEGQKLRRRLAEEVLPKLRRGEAVGGPAAPHTLTAADVSLIVVKAMAEAMPKMIADAVQALRPMMTPSPALLPPPPDHARTLAYLARKAGSINNNRVGWMEHAFFALVGTLPAEGAARAALFAQGINPIGPPSSRRSQNPKQQNLRGVDR